MDKDTIQRLDQLTPVEGFNRTPLDKVILYRSESPIRDAIFMYDSCLVFVAQRRKIGYVNGQQFLYDPEHYLVAPALLPFVCDAEGSPEAPFLALSVPLEHDTVAALISQMEAPAPTDHAQRVPLYSETMTEELAAVIRRLLRCLQSPVDCNILGPQITRELIYRVLQGPNAGVLFDVFSSQNKQIKIARALRHIHEHYATKMDIESLATMDAMSLSSFHNAFKKATACAPLQYIKRVRLNRARDLITVEGMTISAAAYQVGYQSVPQFSREFKRYFGYSPKDAKANYPIQRGG